jgi:PAS domain S-box-containing protein
MNKKTMNPQRPSIPGIRRWKPVLLAGLVSVLILGGGIAYFNYQQASITAEKQQELKTIAEFKISLLSAWLEERYADIKVTAESPFFARSVEEWISSPGNQELSAGIVERMRQLTLEYGYDNVILTAPDGRVLVSLTGGKNELHRLVLDKVKETSAGEKISLSDFYIDTAHGGIHLDILAPILSAGHTVAVLIFEIDPEKYLYPLIQSWPTPSRTAETLLVERQGESVLFLNELRHRPGSAFNLRFSLSERELPAAKAALGWVGAVQGRDYRGVEVLADVRPIPQTPWFLVTKVDAEEIFSDLIRQTVLVSIIAIVLILFAGSGIALIFISRQNILYKRLFLTEKDLSESENEFRTTLYSIGDAVITTDTNGLIRRMNATAQTLTGWTEEEAKGIPLDEVFVIISEEASTPAADPVARVLRDGAVIGLANHTLLVSKNGKEIPIADSGAPIRNASGEITGVVLVFRDQTEERTAKKTLEESEERYRSLFENMLEGFAFCKMLFEEEVPVDFYYLDVNSAFEQLTGLKDVVGKKVTRVIPGIRENDPELIERYGRVSLTGNPEQFEIYVQSLKMWFSISVYSPEHEYFVTVFDVITDRKRSEEALRSSEERYRLFFENDLSGDFITKADGVIISCNSSFARILGFDVVDEIMRMNFFKLCRSGERFEEFISLLTDHRRVENYELELLHKNGRTMNVVANAYGIYDGEGTLCEIVGYLIDETYLRQLERQLVQAQKMDSLGTLAGGIAHDFNNILGIILGHLHLLEELRTKRAEFARAVQIIHQAVYRGVDLVKQLLTFARKSEPHYAPVLVNEIITEVAKLLDETFPKIIVIETNLGGRIPVVSADATQIHQVLLNLSVNARDAMPGGGTLTISSSAVEGETLKARFPNAGAKMYAAISVADTGTGMDAETRIRIFEPFFTTKGPGEGTGLGLSLVYGIIRNHRGIIDVDTETGKGTIFMIYLPVCEEYTADVRAGEEAALEIAGGNERILLIEDEEMLQEYVRTVLVSKGYSVMLARDGEEGVGFYEDHHAQIDLVISDIGLPKLDGAEVFKRIRAVDPKAKVILASGFIDPAVRSRLTEAGAEHFINKPFSRVVILQTIREVLDMGK